MVKVAKPPSLDGAAKMLKPTPPSTKLVQPKTRKGRRYLEHRAPKLVEDARRSLVLYGNKTSQVVKDVLTDLHKLKGHDSVKFTRKNENVRPFEAGGDGSLEFYCHKSNCSLFALGTHSKKRPHNLVLGRLYDFHVYDALELGVKGYEPLKAFARNATGTQAGNKPCIIFSGEKFESVPELKQLKSMLLDFFRGQQVESINLAGIDRVVMATAVDEKQVLLRQYVIKFKKSGTRVPRVALAEMGPRLDLEVRRHRPPPVELEKEAMKKPQLTKKKEKNVSSDLLAGKVGRIYMPKQKVDKMALVKPKGLKRERRQAAADRAEKKQAAINKGRGAAAVAAPAEE